MFKKKRLILFVAIIGLLLLVPIFLKSSYLLATWGTWDLPLSGKVIVVDPGHGGIDGGAGKDTVLEKDIALSVSLKLRDYLQEQGAVVILTRETDTDLAPKDLKGIRKRKQADLKERVDIINANSTDMYISIHLNAIPSPKWRGAQTFYSKQHTENKALGKEIQQSLVSTLQNTDREAAAKNDVYLLKNAKKLGNLVEIGFLSNDEERQLLQNNSYQKKIAFAIYNGITQYYVNEEAK